MENQINEILISIINNTTQAKEFVLSETPDVINQLLLWGAVKGGLCLFIIVILSWLIIFKYSNFIVSGLTIDVIDRSPVRFLLSFFSVLVYLILLIGSFDVIIQAIKIMVAPKIYLIEYAASLVS